MIKQYSNLIKNNLRRVIVLRKKNTGAVIIAFAVAWVTFWQNNFYNIANILEFICFY